MQGKWLIRYGENCEREFFSEIELIKIFLGLESEHRAEGMMAEVESPNGDCLSIGLGKSKSVLCWTPASNCEDYSTSISGIEDPSDDGMISFLFMGDYSEYPSRNFLDLCLAKAAILSFFITGKKPEIIKWE